MIDSMSELLEAVLDSVKVQIAAFEDVKHGPMIGDMYEGSLRELLERAIFRGLDLRVVRGMIKNSKGEFSRQIDCMLVEGDGDQLPGTEHFIYPIERVIAVVEVKKTLYGAGLEDAHDLLTDVSHRLHEAQEMDIHSVRDAWRYMTYTELPSYDEIGNHELAEQMLFLSLMLDANMPLRIVFGYFGYTTERGLREGLLKFIGERVGQADGKGAPLLSPVSLPNLIIEGDFSLIKLNGMPYNGIVKDGWWWLYGSRGRGAIRVLLELLWSRISYRYKLGSEMFGDDMALETVALLLAGRPVGEEQATGWEYKFIEASDEDLAGRDEDGEWEPAFISLEESVIVGRMCHEGFVDLTEPGLLEYLGSHGVTVDELAESLREKGLACTEGGQMTLLTDSCLCGILPDGRFFAGENKSGRVLAWQDRYMRRRRGEEGGTP